MDLARVAGSPDYGILCLLATEGLERFADRGCDVHERHDVQSVRRVVRFEWKFVGRRSVREHAVRIFEGEPRIGRRARSVRDHSRPFDNAERTYEYAVLRSAAHRYVGTQALKRVGRFSTLVGREYPGCEAQDASLLYSVSVEERAVAGNRIGRR